MLASRFLPSSSRLGLVSPAKAASWTVVGGVCLALCGCNASRTDPAGAAQGTEAPHNVRVLELHAGVLRESLPITGTVEAVRSVDVSTEEEGVVRSLPHDKGELVATGDVLVLLDRDLLDARRNSARAALRLRKYNEERTRALLESNSVSKQEMLVAKTEADQAEQDVRMAELRYARAAVKAPFDGMVADRFVEVGQLVAPGMRVARVVDPFTLKLRGWVTERSVAFLKPGAPASVTMEGIAQPIQGEVSWVGIEAEPSSGKFGVEIELDNRALAARAGVVGRARVLKTVHENVLAVPRDALVRGVEGTVVYVVEEGRAVPRVVELGSDEGNMVVVRQGLREGDEVVVRGQRDLSPGSRVQVQEVADRRDGSMESDPAVVRSPSDPVDATDPRAEGDDRTDKGGSSR